MKYFVFNINKKVKKRYGYGLLLASVTTRNVKIKRINKLTNLIVLAIFFLFRKLVVNRNLLITLCCKISMFCFFVSMSFSREHLELKSLLNISSVINFPQLHLTKSKRATFHYFILF